MSEKIYVNVDDVNNDEFITITGFKNYHGAKPFKVGSILKLVKEPNNEYDDESIACEMRYFGKVGYVANNYRTRAKGTKSAGRIYDTLLDLDFAQVKFITHDSVIAKLLTILEQEELKKDSACDINYLLS